jgi:hypothetical protein
MVIIVPEQAYCMMISDDNGFDESVSARDKGISPAAEWNFGSLEIALLPPIIHTMGFSTSPIGP